MRIHRACLVALLQPKKVKTFTFLGKGAGDCLNGNPVQASSHRVFQEKYPSFGTGIFLGGSDGA